MGLLRWLPLLLAFVAAVVGVPAGVSFLLGAALAVMPVPSGQQLAEKSSKPLLQASVVLLGAGASLSTISALGLRGVGLTLAVLLLTLGLAALLGRIFTLPSEVKLLIAFGTSICGASAIAAVAASRRSPPAATATALGVVLSLNALLLYVYPWVATQLGLSPVELGVWSALGIHDTSSVVGAALRYSDAAVAPATTLKLLRALWILPVTALIGLQRTAQDDTSLIAKRPRPWFILGFFFVVGLASLIGEHHPISKAMALVGRRMLGGALLLVGWSLPLSRLRQIGLRPFVFGALLAALVGGAALAMVKLVY